MPHEPELGRSSRPVGQEGRVRDPAPGRSTPVALPRGALTRPGKLSRPLPTQLGAGARPDAPTLALPMVTPLPAASTPDTPALSRPLGPRPKKQFHHQLLANLPLLLAHFYPPVQLPAHTGRSPHLHSGLPSPGPSPSLWPRLMKASGNRNEGYLSSREWEPPPSHLWQFERRGCPFVEVTAAAATDYPPGTGWRQGRRNPIR